MRTANWCGMTLAIVFAAAVALNGWAPGGQRSLRIVILEGEDAVKRNRDIMGATDPSKAAAGTIRKTHAKSIQENSVHGSDAPDTAAKEIAQFFASNEIVG